MSNKPIFTPGPWYVLHKVNIIAEGAYYVGCAKDSPYGRSANEANAALIACAPEMYEALAQASTYLHTLAAVLNTTYQYDSRKEYAKSVLNLAAGMDEKATKIDVLLARARGEAL